MLRARHQDPVSRRATGPAATTALAAAVLFSLAGCDRPGLYSGPLYPVQGRVLLADGNPLQGGTIQFIPVQGGLPASGKIGSDGGFTLKSKSRAGAAPGTYKVRIEPSPELLARRGRGSAAPKLPFASRYRDYDGDTGLTATIHAQETRLEPFRLEAR